MEYIVARDTINIPISYLRKRAMVRYLLRYCRARTISNLTLHYYNAIIEYISNRNIKKVKLNKKKKKQKKRMFITIITLNL